MNLPLNQADKSGNQGNRNNGPMAKAFYDPSNRQKVLDLFKTDNQQQRDDIDKFLTQTNVILRVMSSNNKVAVAEFQEFCIESYIHRLNLFPWMQG